MKKTTIAMTLPILLGMIGPELQAASPSLSQIMPRGGTRGSEFIADFTGDRIQDAQEVLFHGQGISATKIEPVNDKHVKVTFKIAPDAPLGPQAMRLRTATGISEICLFSVGALTEITEPEPNAELAKAPKIALGTTVNGQTDNEDVDYFAFDVAAGQRVNFEIEALRIGSAINGGTIFDPRIAVLDGTGRELAVADDVPLTRQDAAISHTFEKEGTYIVEVRETAYAGNGNCKYRLHVGEFPRPFGAFPSGGQPGQEIEVQWLGDAALDKQKVTLPQHGDDRFGLFPVTDKGVCPTRVPFLISPWPNVMEVEPNNDQDHPTPFTAPAALNGIIDKPGDVDWYQFAGMKDQTYDVRIYSRTLRSGLDPVIGVHILKGNGLGGSDDSGGPDGYVRVKLPQDGEFSIYVHDQLNRGDPMFFYRLEVTPVQPNLTLTLAEQTSIVSAVHAGNRHAILVAANRKDFGGPLDLAVANLPPGITAETTQMPGNVSLVPVLFTAAAPPTTQPATEATSQPATTQAASQPVAASQPAGGIPAGSLVQLTATHAENTSITGHLEQAITLVEGQNRTIFWTHTVDKVAVALAERIPFSIEIVQPKVPIVKNGTMALRVLCKREGDFKGAINLRMLWNPPGMGSSRPAIPADQDETTIHLNANSDAATGKWKIVVIGSSTVPSGPVEVSTQLADLEVADPYVTFEVARARVELGNPVELPVTITKAKDFDGNAKAELVGLPKNTSTTPLDFTKDTTEIKYPITVAQDAPPGRHQGLFVRATVIENGEPIVHQWGGGQLMIDKPLPPKSDEKIEEKKPENKRKRPPRPAAPAANN
jgi:hypothetical protein